VSARIELFQAVPKTAPLTHTLVAIVHLSWTKSGSGKLIGPLWPDHAPLGERLDLGGAGLKLFWGKCRGSAPAAGRVSSDAESGDCDGHRLSVAASRLPGNTISRRKRVSSKPLARRTLRVRKGSGWHT
jgi:hypothetical protein